MTSEGGLRGRFAVLSTQPKSGKSPEAGRPDGLELACLPAIGRGRRSEVMGCGGEEEGGRRGLALRSTERRQVALTAKTFTLSLRRAYEIDGTNAVKVHTTTAVSYTSAFCAGNPHHYNSFYNMADRLTRYGSPCCVGNVRPD